MITAAFTRDFIRIQDAAGEERQPREGDGNSRGGFMSAIEHWAEETSRFDEEERRLMLLKREKARYFIRCIEPMRLSSLWQLSFSCARTCPPFAVVEAERQKTARADAAICVLWPTKKGPRLGALKHSHFRITQTCS
jgi:hypothetical protein